MVREFSKLASKYDFVYCYSVLERNAVLVVKAKSHTLITDGFFPFDPYRLKRSKRFLEEKDSYLEWTDVHPEEEDSGEEELFSDDEFDEAAISTDASSSFKSPKLLARRKSLTESMMDMSSLNL